MRPHDAMFLKLETLFVHVVPRTWVQIAQTCIEIESGTLPPISPHQVYGVVKDDIFRSFNMLNLQRDFTLIETSDFTNVIFMVDRDSEAQQVVRSGRPFREICEQVINIASNEL